MTLWRNNSFRPSFVITENISSTNFENENRGGYSTVCEINAQKVEVFWIVDVLEIIEPCAMQSCSVDDPSFAGLPDMSMPFKTSVLLFSLMRALPKICGHLVTSSSRPQVDRFIAKSNLKSRDRHKVIPSLPGPSPFYFIK